MCVALGTALLAGAGCATTTAVKPRADLPVFSQVDAMCFRGGQPSAEGLRQLHALGVRTVVNLRHRTDEMDAERQAAEALGMRWVNLPMRYWWRPSRRQVREFLHVVRTAQGPIYIHCRQGRNRTSTMAAIYRMAQNGWSADNAYREALGFGLVPWNFLVRDLLYHESAQYLAGGARAS